jgi:hypothetical protein
MRFEGEVAKIKFGMLRGWKVLPYTVVYKACKLLVEN